MIYSIHSKDTLAITGTISWAGIVFDQLLQKEMGMKEMLKLHDREEIDKIHIDEIYEVQAWCELFDVTVTDLRNAIAVVGTSAMKVKNYLEEHNKPRRTSI